MGKTHFTNMSKSFAIISLAILIVCSAVNHDQWEENAAETLSDRHSDEQIYDRIDAKLQAVQDEITSHSKLKFFGGKCPGSCAALGCTGGMGDLMGAVKTSWENVQNKPKMDGVIDKARQDAAEVAGKFGRRLLGRGKTQAA